MNLAKHFVDHIVKTWRAVEEYKKEGRIRGVPHRSANGKFIRAA